MTVREAISWQRSGHRLLIILKLCIQQCRDLYRQSRSWYLYSSTWIVSRKSFSFCSLTSTVATTYSYWVNLTISTITWHLTQINPEGKFKKMLSKSIILDGVFLIEKTKKDEFIRAIEALKLLHDDLNFLITGPWPPYSFVEIAIDKD